MRDICSLLWCALVGLFRSRASLEAEILLLRHQLNVLRRKSPKRMAFTDVDRLVFAGLYHLAPGVLNALKIVKPETVIRWHRAGLRVYWRRRSAPRGGRPQTPLEIRRLIRDVSLANPLWGAPRIHGELLARQGQEPRRFSFLVQCDPTASSVQSDADAQAGCAGVVCRVS